MFPASPDGISVVGGDEPDASMDRLVVAISTDLIDDLPSSDPRWLETLPASESAAASSVKATNSLLILRQLEDKKVCLDFYLNFLREVGIWDRVSAISLFVYLLVSKI